ncbi:MAG: hypothetical protein KF865_11450 [Bdellovibrionaceae bacterium]|nr:hypothetical protein [Pseudobdellovibrionaceae bacterium]
METLSKSKIPPLDDSLRAAARFFKNLLPALLQALFLMELIRFLIFWNSRTHFILMENAEILKAFAVGLRFDSLVLGFAMIPVVLIVLLAAWLRRGLVIAGRLSCWFLILFWLFFCGLSMFDLFFFSFSGRHLTVYDFSGGDGRFATTVGQRLGWETLLLTIGIFLCLAVLGLRGFIKADAPEREMPGPAWSWGRRLGFSFGTLLLVALAARGTVTPHHLEKSHSEVSSFSVVNQLVLNPLWAFDKKPEEE